MTTAQEAVWKSEFGDEYAKRNQGKVEANIALFAEILKHTSDISRIIEYGAGTGQNLAAIKKLMPSIELIGVEINEQASLEIPVGYVFTQSMFDFVPPNHSKAQLAFTKGLLIHIEEKDLPHAYDQLFVSSTKYIMMAEYYSPKPREIEYHGKSNMLWARDFGGEFMDRFPSVKLIDYGFVWRRDQFPQDDITWWLFEK
jgi:pseudaminic acid biosynthesis-associated methylase